jgi:hypothetical protein
VVVDLLPYRNTNLKLRWRLGSDNHNIGLPGGRTGRRSRRRAFGSRASAQRTVHGFEELGDIDSAIAVRVAGGTRRYRDPAERDVDHGQQLVDPDRT